MAGSGDHSVHPTRRRAISRIVFGILLALTSVLFVLVVRPFLMPMLLAAITAGVFSPLRQRLLKAFGGRRAFAAAVTHLLVVLIVVIPVSGLVYLAIANVLRLARTVSTWGPDVHRMIVSVLRFAQQLGLAPDGEPSTILGRDSVLGVLQHYSSGIAGRVSHFLGNALRTVLTAIVYLYSLFFFLRDGDAILKSLLDYIPVDRDQKDSILSHFVSVARATIKGTIVMGIIQGVIAGVGFFVAGVRSPLLWGLLIGLLAALPNFGPILIWLPAGLLLAFAGHPGSALVVLLGVGGLMGVCDYVIRPRIIGDDIRMHDLLVFFGIFGGVALFGLAGILIGPIVMAVFVQVWSIFRLMYESDYRAANAMGPQPPD
ncbi:MAG TPA: AI-2E family transporter [Spirochaetia bacterium]|nr:AI-2E family transporter [Spirochaetia bacterium]